MESNADIKSIFLVGFMGSGKSTLGIQLAKLLNFHYVDLDKRFLTNTGKSINDFFAENSENEFRKVESDLLKSIDVNEKVLIACGGGTPCFYDNMEWMNQQGLTVYLNVMPEFLFERLRNSKANRPLIKAMNDDELRSYIVKELTYRDTFYKKAKMTISGAVNAHRLKSQIVQYYEFMSYHQSKVDNNLQP